jgi:hypothetical protein
MNLDHIRTAHGMLAAKVLTTYHVDWLTYPYNIEKGQMGLETVFEAAYGKSMEMVGGNNGDIMSHTVVKEPMGPAEIAEIAKGVARGHFESYSLAMYLKDLCNKDVIPPGAYCVSMSW